MEVTVFVAGSAVELGLIVNILFVVLNEKWCEFT